MSSTFFVTRPDHDLITTYLFHWSKALLDLAENKGLSVVDVKGNKVQPDAVAGRLSKLKPSLILLNGHGSKSTIHGHENSLLVDHTNSHILEGAVTYARACSSAHTLGNLAVGNGAKAYIGYTAPFTMFYDTNKVQHPLDDTVASLFLEPSNHVVVSLLKGHTAGEASARSKELSKKKLLSLMTSNATSEDKIYARYLWHNMQSQACLGNTDATAIS